LLNHSITKNLSSLLLLNIYETAVVWIFLIHKSYSFSLYWISSC